MVYKKNNETGSLVLALALLVASALGAYISRASLLQQKNSSSAALDERPPLYLPRADKVRSLTFGFDTVASKILWFKTINYFGKQFTGSQDYRWLANMCDVVTELDPKARHVFEFCGTLLSWVAKEPTKSDLILTKAIESDPSYWRYYYLRAFNSWYFLNRFENAKKDLMLALEMPEAPNFLKTLAVHFLAGDQGPEVAREFLKDLLANTTDKNVKKALKRKLKGVLRFSGKTAETGVMSQEFSGVVK